MKDLTPEYRYYAVHEVTRGKKSVWRVVCREDNRVSHDFGDKHSALNYAHQREMFAPLWKFDND